MILFGDSNAKASLSADFDMESETATYYVRYGNGTTEHSDFGSAVRHFKVCIAQAKAEIEQAATDSAESVRPEEAKQMSTALEAKAWLHPALDDPRLMGREYAKSGTAVSLNPYRPRELSHYQFIAGWYAEEYTLKDARQAVAEAVLEHCRASATGRLMQDALVQQILEEVFG